MTSLPTQSSQASAGAHVVLTTLLVALVYVGAGQISLLLKHPLGGISPLWLGSGVALVALLHFGRRAVPGVIVGSIAGSLVSGYTPASAAFGAIASVAEVLLAHEALRRGKVTLTNLLDSIRTVLRFVVNAALPAALLGASLGVSGMLVTGNVAVDGALQGLALWFAGDFVGMVLGVPLVVAYLRARANRAVHHAHDNHGTTPAHIADPLHSHAAAHVAHPTLASHGAHHEHHMHAAPVGQGTARSRIGLSPLVPMVLAVVATVVIFFLTDVTREGNHVFGYLLFPLIVWTALVASTAASTLTHSLVAGLAIVGTALGLGPYAVTASPTDVGLLQAFVIAVAGTSLLLKSAMEDRRRALARLHHQSVHDALTGLPNRRGMQRALTGMLDQARRDTTSMGVLFVDLDNFKVVNDAVGHQGGDEVLAELAKRYQRTTRVGQLVARPGGDEFVMLAGQTLAGLSSLAQRIVDATREPVSVGTRQFHLTCSVGIARFPEDGDDATSLMRYADIAMYEAKLSGKNSHTHFTPDIRVRRMKRVELEVALRGALQRGEFALYYQPQVDMITGELVGAEALLRWRHDSLGMVPPGVFVPISEDLGLIDEVGQWVIDNACGQLRRWIDAGHQPPRVAVNLSPMQLSADLAVNWRRAIDGAGLTPELLEAELTESCIMRDERTSAVALQDLSRQGVQVSLDDFGTGHSSLSLLTKLPLNTVKIDQSFIHQVGTRDGAQVVSAIVTLSHRLGLRCMAEGVETESQEAFLRDIGCDAYQGFLISEALPADQFAQRFLQRDAVMRAQPVH